MGRCFAAGVGLGVLAARTRRRERAKRAAHSLAAAVLALAASAAVAAAGAEPAQTVPPDVSWSDLAPEIQRAVRATGLVGAGEPVAPFEWTLEVKRPMRKPFRVVERYAGTQSGEPAGATSLTRSTFDPAGKPTGVRKYLSVRGLFRVRADDDRLDAEVDGVKMPLAAGSAYRVTASRAEDERVTQRCTVADRVPAAQVFAALPGEAIRIRCAGEAQWHGVKIGLETSVFYLERLGVFIGVHDTFRSPVGKLETVTRVLSFRAEP